MKTTIKTPFGEMTFDICQEHAIELINMASQYARFDAPPMPAPEPEAPVEPVTSFHTYVPEKTIDPPAPRRRAETMFGAKSEWNMPAAGKKPQQRRDDDKAEREAYKGFLYIKCEKCGKVKGFCAKNDLFYHQCECGHRTKLHGLRVAHVYCRCGQSFKYKTNIDDERFDIHCISCGSIIDMELNGNGDTFVTMGRKPARGGDINNGTYVFRKQTRF